MNRQVPIADRRRAAAPSRPLRVAFVGQGVFFRQCALEQPAGGIEPTFIEFVAGAPPAPLRARLRSLDPDVVLVFRPEMIPPGLFDSLGAVTLGYLTEPLPRDRGAHPDLRTRMWMLRQVDPGSFDRIVCFDPLIADSAETVLPVWRSLALPVADSFFGPLRDPAIPPRLLFLGRSTPYREEWLEPVKRSHAIVHIAHGLAGAARDRLLAASDVSINLHNHPYPSFEQRVPVALAAGHLVISEPLSPRHGLEPGVDYLEVASPAALLELVDALAVDPTAYADVRASGRRAAENFRASHVYPELITAALASVASDGRGTRRTAS
jgi:hypothetical protein